MLPGWFPILKLPIPTYTYTRLVSPTYEFMLVLIRVSVCQSINPKRVYRIGKQEGLQVSMKKLIIG